MCALLDHHSCECPCGELLNQEARRRDAKAENRLAVGILDRAWGNIADKAWLRTVCHVQYGQRTCIRTRLYSGSGRGVHINMSTSKRGRVRGRWDIAFTVYSCY